MANETRTQAQQLLELAFLAPKSLQRMTTQGTAADCRPGRRNDSRARPPYALVGSGSGRLAAAWAREATAS